LNQNKNEDFDKSFEKFILGMGFLPSVHLDLFIPIQQLKIDDAELQYLKREEHM
jgi:hypothetical protein